ncbi:MAG: 4Fe-4S dicluster domain-containing protein [Deltaproteobacteria bacterium]|nr:4Fe-4S dicluster domain-containing protein [Deltaproteobacteria bacterium]
MARARVARRIVQVALLVAFAAYLVWPVGAWPGEALFKVDAVAVAGAALAHRAVFLSIAFAAGLIALTFFLGRVFCGWACPLGCVVDAVDFVAGRRVRAASARRVKYHVLTITAGFAAAGVAIAFLLDPMSLAARIGTIASPSRSSLVSAVALAVALVAVEVGLGRRGFCRVLCPLGALLGCVARVSPFGREIGASCTHCGACTTACRAAAIGGTSADFIRSECVHCYDCAAACQASAITFGYLRAPIPKRPDPMRRESLVALAGGAVVGFVAGRIPWLGESRAVRPPGAVDKTAFGRLCIRCGSCIRVCPTGGLEPATDEAGPLLLETPVLNGREGGCAFDCNACGRVCPTGAIRPLALLEKRKDRIGVARVDGGRCVALAAGGPCVVCFAACPVAAIRLVPTGKLLPWGEHLLAPTVVENACTGCGLCEARCPIAGDAAIRIFPVDPARMAPEQRAVS